MSEVTNELHLFLDESGDLGFKTESSKFFLIGIIVIESELPFSRIFKKERQRLKKKMKNLVEFKFSESSTDVRKRILGHLQKVPFGFSYFVIHKNRVEPHLRDKQNVLYTFLAGRLLESILYDLEKSRLNKICLSVDKSLYSERRASFDEYVRNHRIPFDLLEKVEISHRGSQELAGLQAVDFICGAIYHKFEHGNNEYYDIIKSKEKLAMKWVP